MKKRSKLGVLIGVVAGLLLTALLIVPYIVGALIGAFHLALVVGYRLGFVRLAAIVNRGK